jgi:hypothetical protein
MQRRILQAISWLACLGTVVPSLMYFGDLVSLKEMQFSMLVAALVWFAVTPLWMGHQRAGQSDEKRA